MTIRLIHSNDVTLKRSDIATRYTDIFFDDETNSIILPDPSGMLETKIGATGAGTGIKGFASGYVNAGAFVTLDNIRATVTGTWPRGLSVATVAGTMTLSISGSYALAGGASGNATAYPGANYTTTPSGSWFGWGFGNAGDASTYLINDYANKKFYRIHLMIGASYIDNFISIERLY